MLSLLDGIHHHKNGSHQVVLCLNVTKINNQESDSRSLSQQCLLNPVVPNCLPASLNLSLCCPKKVTETLFPPLLHAYPKQSRVGHQCWPRHILKGDYLSLNVWEVGTSMQMGKLCGKHLEVISEYSNSGRMAGNQSNWSL